MISSLIRSMYGLHSHGAGGIIGLGTSLHGGLMMLGGREVSVSVEVDVKVVVNVEV